MGSSVGHEDNRKRNIRSSSSRFMETVGSREVDGLGGLGASSAVLDRSKFFCEVGVVSGFVKVNPLEGFSVVCHNSNSDSVLSNVKWINHSVDEVLHLFEVSGSYGGGRIKDEEKIKKLVFAWVAVWTGARIRSVGVGAEVGTSTVVVGAFIDISACSDFSVPVTFKTSWGKSAHELTGATHWLVSWWARK